MDNDFKDNILQIFSYLLDEDVMYSMNATEDLFSAGKKYFTLDIDTEFCL